MPDRPSHPPASIAKATWLRNPATQRVFDCLNKQGHVARAVGGCVRNSLLDGTGSTGLEIEPAFTDVDIATTATPEQSLALAAAAGLRTAPTGLQHGTITIITDGQGFEVTTLRRDVATDGRHAQVAFTNDWALDAARRDLTINALYANSNGTLFDPLDGYDDLLHRRIRFVGEPKQRIREDYLRILRFFRFYAQYGQGPLDLSGLEACISERRGLAQLSPERIRQELLKLLIAPGVTPTLTLMAEHGLLAEIAPAVPNIARMARLIELDVPSSDAALRLAALLISVEEDALRLADDLRLSRSEKAVLSLAASALSSHKPGRISELVARQMLYKYGPENFERLIKFHGALDNRTLSPNLWLNLLALPERWQAPTFPISGHELLQRGSVPGQAMGQLLQALELIWVDSDFQQSREMLLKEAEKRLPGKKLTQRG
jgi:poly(A) polymerase